MLKYLHNGHQLDLKSFNKEIIRHFFFERIPFFSFLLWIRQSRQAGAIGGAAGARRGGALGGGDHVDGGGGGDGGLGGGLMERGGKPPVARNSSSTLPLVHSLPGSQNNFPLSWWRWRQYGYSDEDGVKKSTITGITSIITIITIMTTMDLQWQE